MNNLIEKFKGVKTDCCITIAMNTNRTAPDSRKDPLVLKNMVKIAEDRVCMEYEKKFAEDIIARLNDLVETIDHSRNQESLLVFVNETVAEYIRLPVSVKTRVVIDRTFATRDLVRAIHEQITYYILVLNRGEARLVKAHNDSDIEEIEGDFPISNDSLFNTDPHQKSIGKSNNNLVEEFFNIVDKSVQKVQNNTPLPVVVITEERNYQHLIKVADNKEVYVLHVNKNRGNESDKPHHIVNDVWPAMYGYLKEKNARRIEELNQAVSTGKFLSDVNDIYKAIMEGRGQTIFVHNEYFQPGMIKENRIHLLDEVNRNDIDVTDDIIDKLIEKNHTFGGDVVFIENDDLKDFHGIALSTRF